MKVVIINPGSHPAPSYIAEALAADQRLSAYWTSAQFLPSETARLGQQFQNASKARTLPQGIPGSLVRRRGVTQDLVATYWRRLRRREREVEALYRRNQAVARAAVRFALSQGRHDEQVGLLFSTNTRGGAAPLVLRAEIAYALYTPLPYLPALTALMDAEAEANPRWARFLAHRSGGGSDSDPDAEVEVAGASFVLANSRLTAQSYAGVIAPERILTQPLAVDLELLNVLRASRPNTQLRDTATPLRLLFAGQVTQRKGLSYLFQGLESLSDRRIELTVVGSDPLGMSAELVRAFPHVRVRFRGPVSQPQLWDEMGRQDVLVLPSLAEGLANVLLEALALGMPVVATDRSGAADLEVDGVAGIVVPHSDSTALAGALARLSDDDGTLLAEFGEGAVRLSHDRGTWADYGRRLAGALDRPW